MLSHASTTPPEAELRIEPGQPSLASVANATPVEPDEEPGESESHAGAPPNESHIPEITELARYDTAKGHYLFQLCDFGRGRPCFRLTSVRNDRSPFNLTIVRPAALAMYAALTRYLAETDAPRRPDETAEPTRRGKVDPSRLVPR
jgi:hypothetical protein